MIGTSTRVDLKSPNCNGRECFASVLYSFLAIANREVARRFAIAMVRRLVLSHIRGSARSHMPSLIWLCAARLVVTRNASHKRAARWQTAAIAVVTETRICESQEVHPVFTFTVMFTFQFSAEPADTALSLSLSIYSALRAGRSREKEA